MGIIAAMRTWWVMALLASSVQVVHADETAEPWKTGVSLQAQDRANGLFAQGTDLFAKQAFPQALAAYEEALAVWDHPRFRFHQAVVLVRLDRVLDAASSIDSALRFGAAPFTPEVYGQVLQYQKLVQGNVGTLEATCTQAGAQMLLDSKMWFQCPGTQSQRVLIGDHVVYAELPRFVARPTHVTVTANARVRAEVAVVPLEQAFEHKRRFPIWAPWTILGSGVAVGIAGIAFAVSGHDKVNEYDNAIASRCAVNGCSQEDLAALQPLLDSGQFRSGLGTAGIIVGSAAVIGGFVMAMLNRPTPSLRVEFRGAGGGAAASAAWRF